MTALDQLQQWFERDIRSHPWIGVLKAEPLEGGSGIRFSTRAFTYLIHVDEAEPGKPSYLGCTFTVMGRRQGGDLPDGEFSGKTWQEIVLAIIENEAQHARKRSRGG
jgi:hypothetical protein